MLDSQYVPFGAAESPRPFRFPAKDRSVHGNEAVAMSTLGIGGIDVPYVAEMKIVASEFGSYISFLAASMSLAQTTSTPARCRPRRMSPIPAKNSAARSRGAVVWGVTARRLSGRSERFPGLSMQDRRRHDLRRVAQRHVLPDSHYVPAFRRQHGGDPGVTLTVAADLRAPIFAVGGRHSAMFGMPIAAVDEHGNARPWKNNVGVNAHRIRDNRVVLAKTQATSMQFGPQAALRRGVHSAIRLHRPACRGVCRLGCRRQRLHGASSSSSSSAPNPSRSALQALRSAIRRQAPARLWRRDLEQELLEPRRTGQPQDMSNERPGSRAHGAVRPRPRPALELRPPTWRWSRPGERV